MVLRRHSHPDATWVVQLDLPVQPAWVRGVAVLFPKVQRMRPMDLAAVPSHVVFAGPLAAMPAEHQPLSVKIHKRLRRSPMAHHGVVYLPLWSVIEGSLGVVAVTKGDVFEGHMPLVYVGSWDVVVP